MLALLFFEKLFVLFDFPLATDHERHTLMKTFGLKIHNTLVSSGGFASGLLGDESQWCRFVEESKLRSRSLGIAIIGGVDEDSASQQVTMEVGY